MGHLPRGLAEIVRRLAAGLRDLYGDRFRGLLLYGSHARGEATEGSDLDLILLLEGPVDAVEEIVRIEPVKWPLSLAGDVVLSVVPISREAFERAGTAFLETVRREAIVAA